MRRTWQELWYNMAGGLESERERIKAMNVFEFWGVFDLWRNKLKNDTKNYKNGRRKQ